MSSINNNSSNNSDYFYKYFEKISNRTFEHKHRIKTKDRTSIKFDSIEYELMPTNNTKSVGYNIQKDIINKINSLWTELINFWGAEPINTHPKILSNIIRMGLKNKSKYTIETSGVFADALKSEQRYGIIPFHKIIFLVNNIDDRINLRQMLKRNGRKRILSRHDKKTLCSMKTTFNGKNICEYNQLSFIAHSFADWIVDIDIKEHPLSTESLRALLNNLTNVKGINIIYGTHLIQHNLHNYSNKCVLCIANDGNIYPCRYACLSGGKHLGNILELNKFEIYNLVKKSYLNYCNDCKKCLKPYKYQKYEYNIIQDSLNDHTANHRQYSGFEESILAINNRNNVLGFNNLEERLVSPELTELRVQNIITPGTSVGFDRDGNFVTLNPEEASYGTVVSSTGHQSGENGHMRYSVTIKPN